MKFGPGQVARRRAERHEVGVAALVSGLPSPAPVGPVPASASRMPVIGPPQLVEVLRLPDGDAGVGHGDVAPARAAGRARRVRGPHALGDRHRDLVVEARRRAQARRAVVGPVDADVRLVGGPHGRRDSPSPPRRFTSLNAAAYSALAIAGGGGARNWLPRSSTNGVTLPQCAPSATGSGRPVLPPVPGRVAGEVVDADPRLGMVRASSARSARIAAAARRPERRCRRSCARRPDRNGRRSAARCASKLGGLRREQRHQRVVRRLRDRRRRREVPARARRGRCSSRSAPTDRVHGIEHRDVHDRHGARRPAGAELLAEDPRILRRRVV